MKDRTHELIINLNEKEGVDEIIKGIPKGTEILDLSGCFYHEPDEVMVSKLFKFIPSSVNTLKFPQIIRDNIKWEDLPKNVNHVVFSFPDGNIPIHHSNFSSLPDSVTSVDLGCHVSHDAETKEEPRNNFEPIVESEPPTPVDCNYNNVDPSVLLKCASYIRDVFKLPDHIKRVSFAGYNFDMNEFSINLLPHMVSEYLAKKNVIDIILNENAIVPLVEIDENRLPIIIKTLEELNTPAASLTCGLLLSGAITTVRDADNTPKDEDAYNEARLQDAIHFYLKARKDQKLEPVVDFILWHLKTIIEYPSVTEKLAKLDIPPPSNDLIQSYKHYGDTLPTKSKISTPRNIQLFDKSPSQNMKVSDDIKSDNNKTFKK